MKKILSIVITLCMVMAIIPIAELTVMAEGAATAVTVCGTAVTGDNAADVLGDGTVSYNSESSTLTLNGAALAYTGSTPVSVTGDVTLVLTGENSITVTSANYAIHVIGNMNVEGTGKLTVRFTDECIGASVGILVDGSLTVDSGTFDIIAGDAVYGSFDFFGSNPCGGQSYGIYTTGNIIINGGRLDLVGGAGTDTSGHRISHSFGISGYYVTVNAGTVNATGSTTTGRDGSSGGMMVEGITVNGGTVNAVSGASDVEVFGIYSESAVIVTGSAVVTATASGSMEGSLKDSFKNYGVYARGALTVGGTAALTASSGNINSVEDGYSYGVYCRGDITVGRSASLRATAGEVNVTGYAESYGIKVSGNQTLNVNGGFVSATGKDAAGDSKAESFGVYIRNVNVNGGSLITSFGTVTGKGSLSSGSVDADSAAYTDAIVGASTSAALFDAINNTDLAGIALTADVTIDKTFTVSRDFTLDLNGHELKYSSTGYGSVIRVNSGVTFTLNDSSPAGTGTVTGGTGLEVVSDLSDYVEGMVLKYYYGGGVFNTGDFIMNGGTIKDCLLTTSFGDSTCSFGGGVYTMNDGTFTMNGGSIENCSAVMGAGVYIQIGDPDDPGFVPGFFIMNGGTVKNCTGPVAPAVFSESVDVTFSGNALIDSCTLLEQDFYPPAAVIINGGNLFAEGGTVNTDLAFGVPFPHIPAWITRSEDATGYTAFNGEVLTDCNYIDDSACPYTVTFDPKGGTEVASQHILKGQKATEPAAPSKTGWTFGGWYDGETEWNFGTAPTSSITLTASWACAGHKDEDAKDHKCDVCGETIDSCTDPDKDHVCNWCGAPVGTHEDKDHDHVCDYGCDVAIGACEDTDKDHKCDYGCGKDFGTHEDKDHDHVCDYGCKVAIGACEDPDKDHKCDYGCGKDFGTHEDKDHDHVCDYGCKVAIGDCEDTDKDHKCDHGCGKDFGTHEDKDHDHVCDYGCKAVIGDCEDTDKDHKCDYGCGKDFGTHEDKDHDHKCDYGCKVAIGACEDTDKDHKCDHGCGKDFGTHEDLDKDHNCDYCGDGMSDCDDTDPKDHKCDLCGKILSNCSGGKATCRKKAVCAHCGNEYGEIDSTCHEAMKHTKATAATESEEGNTEYWHCEDCDKYYSDKDGKTEITLSDTVVAKTEPSHQTGDVLFFLIALLLVSGTAMVVTATSFKKRKNSAK